MDLIPFAARYRLGVLNSDAIRKLAESVLSTGQATATWVEIATTSDPIMSTVGPLFERGLREAGIDLPTADDAVWQAARYHIQRIAHGDVAPRDGARELLREVYDAGDLHLKEREFVGDSHGLSELIGNYYSYDELEERPTEVSCDGLYGKQAMKAMDRHIVANAKDWLRRYGV